MSINTKLLTLFMVVVVLTTTAQGAKRKSTPINEEQEISLKQSQSTFVQWVLSLLPQRPSLETLTAGVSGSTTTAAPLQSTTVKATTTAATVKTTLQPQGTSTTPSSISTSTTSATSTPTPTATSTPAPSSSTISPSLPPITIIPPVLDPPRNCSECVCGVANTQKRIVGGQETEIHQYPWMSMLLYGGRFYCAATLINDQYLVTASHCVYGFRKERISVRLLEHNRKMSNFQKIDRKVAEVTTHPKYNARTYDNDIAIIKLDAPVEMTELMHPVCMPTPGKSFKGETGTVTGWGALKVGGPTSDSLQEVQVPIMSQDECRKTRYGPSRITDNMLCAGYEVGMRDSCQGDSGGPLHVVAPGTREHQLAGVVSWGEGCAKAGYPGVYARVNRYGTWIKTMTKNACLCQSETKKIKK